MVEDWPPAHKTCTPACQASNSGAEHRRAEVIAHRTLAGRCRVCLDVIRRKDGSISSRTWHPECWERYALHSGNMRYIRERVWRRDHGVCASCAREHKYSGIATWQADHIVSLIDGGSFELDNLQTLCTYPCHAKKTASEAKARAGERRVEKRRNSPQLHIVL